MNRSNRKEIMCQTYKSTIYTSSSSSVEVLDLNHTFGREAPRSDKKQDIGNSGQAQDLDSSSIFAKQMTPPG